MKFAIGIESVNYFEPQINEVISDEDSLVNDNITHLQFKDYNSAFESVNAEIEIMLKGYEVQGTEADDTQKKNIFVRLWEAIKKMFRTLGKWVGDAFKWVARKFGFGGANNPNTINTNTAEAVSESFTNVVEELKKEDMSENKTEEVVVPEAKVEEIIETVVNKVYSKPKFKFVTLQKHHVKTILKEIIAKETKPTSTAIAIRNDNNQNFADMVLINVAKIVNTTTIEIPIMYFDEVVLERLKKEGFSTGINGSNQIDYDRLIGAYSWTRIKGENNKNITTPYVLSTIIRFLLDVAYCNGVMVNVILDFDINTSIITKIRDSMDALKNVELESGDLATAKSNVFALLSVFKTRSGQPHMSLKTTKYNLELHKVIAKNGSDYKVAEKNIINLITGDKTYKLNEELFKLLDLCAGRFSKGFVFVEKFFESDVFKEYMGYQKPDKSENAVENERKKLLMFTKAMLVDIKEICKHSVKFLSKCKPMIDKNIKNLDKMGIEKFAANNYA